MTGDTPDIAGLLARLERAAARPGFAVPPGPLRVAAAAPEQEAEAEAEAEPAPDLPAELQPPVLRAAVDRALELLDIMAAPAGCQPPERAAAGLLLAGLFSGLDREARARVSGRLLLMDAPPPELVRALLAQPEEDAVCDVLARGHLDDGVLAQAAASGGPDRLRALASRRIIGPQLAAALVARGDSASLLKLLSNDLVVLTRAALAGLAALAAERPELQASLCRRPELPPDLAFGLFWSLPSALRRVLLRRFLAGTATLERILRLGAPPLPRQADPAALLGDPQMLASALGIRRVTAARILADDAGEARVIALRALGLPGDALPGLLPQRAAGAELAALFGELSPAKARVARVALLHWDVTGDSTAG